MKINEEEFHELMYPIAEMLSRWLKKYGPMPNNLERATLKNCINELVIECQIMLNTVRETQKLSDLDVKK